MNEGIKHGIRLGICGFVLMGTACSQNGTTPSTDEATPTSVSSQRQEEKNMNTSTDGITPNQQVYEAVADLAARTGIAADAISVKQARSVHWGSGALGCPQEGMNYTQAIVPGVQLLLEAGDTVYRYHGRTGGKLTFCPEDRAQEPAYGPGQEFM